MYSSCKLYLVAFTVGTVPLLNENVMKLCNKNYDGDSVQCTCAVA